MNTITINVLLIIPSADILINTQNKMDTLIQDIHFILSCLSNFLFFDNPVYTSSLPGNYFDQIHPVTQVPNINTGFSNVSF